MEAEPEAEWPLERLRELTTSIEYGYTAPATAEKRGPKFLRITDLEQGRVDWDSVPYCECAESADHLLQSGDIVIARTGATTGKSYFLRTVPEPSVFASYLIRVRCAASLLPEYLQHFLQSSEYWRQITRFSVGSAQPGANATILSTLRVPRPDVPEQRAIARVLDAADAAIERTRTAVEAARRLKRGLVQTLLTRGIGTDGRIRDPKQHPQEFEETDAGYYPVGWELVKLRDVADVGSGVTLGQDLSGIRAVELPYLRVANVQDGFIDTSEMKTVRVPEGDVEGYTLQAGDVLLTEGGDFDKLGRGGVWDGRIAPCLHQNHIFRVRPDQARLNPHYLAAVIGSEYGKRHFLRIAKRTTNLASINKTQLRAFPFLRPEKPEQDRIVAILNAAEENIQRLTRIQDANERLKRGLMQVLLTGKVRLPAADTAAMT